VEHRLREEPALVLVDSGAELNYITHAFAEKLQALGLQVFRSNTPVETIPALHDARGTPFPGIASDKFMYLDVKFKNVIPSPDPTIRYSKRVLNIPFLVIPSLHNDLEMIIGMETIRAQDLTRVLRLHFASRSQPKRKEAKLIQRCYDLLDVLSVADDSELSEDRRQEIAQEFSRTAALLARRGRHIALARSMAPSLSETSDEDSSSDVSETASTRSSRRVTFAAPLISSVDHPEKSSPEYRELNDLLDFEEPYVHHDPFEGTFDIGEMLPESPISTDTSGHGGSKPPEEDVLPKMLGDTPFHKQIHALCATYRDIFSREVRPTSAKVDPLLIKLRADSKFHIKEGEAPRKQSVEKQKEILRQVEQMLRLGVIRRSSATTYSQVTLAPKPNSDKLRFCIDYRWLNANLEQTRWVIPNIRSVLERIGSKKSTLPQDTIRLL
jgi:hypothetical protein